MNLPNDSRHVRQTVKGTVTDADGTECPFEAECTVLTGRFVWTAIVRRGGQVLMRRGGVISGAGPADVPASIKELVAAAVARRF